MGFLDWLKKLASPTPETIQRRAKAGSGPHEGISKIDVFPPVDNVEVVRGSDRMIHRVDEGAAFRQDSDGEHVVRFKHTHLKGFHRIVARKVKLAGISQPEWLPNAAAFLEAHERHIVLERYPDNPQYPNAIRVIGLWKEDGEDKRGQIGWIPADVSKSLAEDIPSSVELGATLQIIYRPRDGGSPGVRMDVWASE